MSKIFLISIFTILLLISLSSQWRVSKDNDRYPRPGDSFPSFGGNAVLDGKIYWVNLIITCMYIYHYNYLSSLLTALKKNISFYYFIRLISPMYALLNSQRLVTESMNLRGSMYKQLASQLIVITRIWHGLKLQETWGALQVLRYPYSLILTEKSLRVLGSQQRIRIVPYMGLLREVYSSSVTMRS